ncbi:MAG: hypothetical protein JST87_05210 [Bacteroidetes bacterium]|nr:hypothetical protein [Bacteroidota bacterium]
MTIETQPNATVTTSKQFWLNVRDFLKALLVAALSTPITVTLTSFSQGKFTINFTDMWHMAAISASAYLLKNFFTPTQTVIKGDVTKS